MQDKLLRFPLLIPVPVCAPAPSLSASLSLSFTVAFRHQRHTMKHATDMCLSPLRLPGLSFLRGLGRGRSRAEDYGHLIDASGIPECFTTFPIRVHRDDENIHQGAEAARNSFRKHGITAEDKRLHSAGPYGNFFSICWPAGDSARVKLATEFLEWLWVYDGMLLGKPGNWLSPMSPVGRGDKGRACGDVGDQWLTALISAPCRRD
jgi:hypothetical protein